MTETRILIDGDLLLFQRMAAAETTHNFGDDLWGYLCDHRQAIGHFSADVADYVYCILQEYEDAAPERVRPCLFFSSAVNWRKKVMPVYKLARKGTRKPCGWEHAIQTLSAMFDTYIGDGLEADDGIGLAATNPAMHGRTVIVSGDKDLRTIPGYHLNPNDLDAGVITVTKDEADRFWLIQALSGDRTDGYPGAAGVGPVKADRILPPLEEWSLKQALRTARGQFKTSEEFVENMLVSRILRHSEWSKGKVVPARIPGLVKEPGLNTILNRGDFSGDF